MPDAGRGSGKAIVPVVGPLHFVYQFLKRFRRKPFDFPFDPPRILPVIRIPATLGLLRILLKKSSEFRSELSLSFGKATIHSLEQTAAAPKSQRGAGAKGSDGRF